MSRWFRHYAGMMRDEKLVAAAVRSRQTVERVVWVWGAILESASEIEDAGRYEIDSAEVAYFLRSDEADIASILEALANAGRVADGAVVKWGDRQYQSDKSAERQARYRERKQAQDRHSNIRTVASDAAVTSRDDVVTPPETETETDRKEEPNGSSKKRGCRLPADFLPDLQWAEAEGLTSSQAQTEAAKFRDYWNGKTGASASKLDWPGTWRNWVRHALERMPQGIRGSPPSKASSSALAESAARLVQSMRSADEIRSGSSGPGIPALIPHLPLR